MLADNFWIHCQYNWRNAEIPLLKHLWQLDWTQTYSDTKWRKSCLFSMSHKIVPNSPHRWQHWFIRAHKLAWYNKAQQIIWTELVNVPIVLRKPAWLYGNCDPDTPDSHNWTYMDSSYMIDQMNCMSDKNKIYQKEANTFELSLKFRDYKNWPNTWAIIQELIGATMNWCVILSNTQRSCVLSHN